MKANKAETSSAQKTCLSVAGSFVSIPSAMDGVEPGLKSAFKMQFRTIYSEESTNPLGLETVFAPDRMLIDLQAVDPKAIDPRKLIRDCDLLKNLVQEHPEQLRRLVQAFQPANEGARVDWSAAAKIAEEIGFTEKHFQKAGGGFLPLLVIAVAALCASCSATCSKTVKPDKGPEKE